MSDFIEIARRLDEYNRIGNDTSAKMDRLVAAFLAREPLPQLDDLIALSRDTTARLNAAVSQYTRPSPHR